MMLFHHVVKTYLGMGTKVRILSVLLSTDSRKIKLYPVSPPKHIIMTLREWKSGRFSMPDMSTALHAQECNDVSSRSYSQQRILIETTRKYCSTFQNAIF
ncbi:hypothetical protein ILYODFUR_000662 [Ilyodon furcidens]|uniref:Uncharacterized protein n=1 Tax=Ilyodon furcidens TaxID=33524 RepID=A0ABV0SUD4_9TELE